MGPFETNTWPFQLIDLDREISLKCRACPYTVVEEVVESDYFLVIERGLDQRGLVQIMGRIELEDVGDALEDEVLFAEYEEIVLQVGGVRLFDRMDDLVAVYGLWRLSRKPLIKLLINEWIAEKWV